MVTSSPKRALSTSSLPSDCSREAVLSPTRKTITVSTSLLWFLKKSKRIEFDWVAAILYDNKLIEARTYGVDINFLTPTISEYDVERITVRLALKNGEVVRLFTFSGPIGISFMDVCVSYTREDISFNAEGSHEPMAKYYARALAYVMGAPISKEMNF